MALLVVVCLSLFCIGLFSERFWWFCLTPFVCIVIILMYKPKPKSQKLSYKNAALCYPDMAEARSNNMKVKNKDEQTEEQDLSRYYASGNSIYFFVKNGDPELDTIPEHELLQQHASEFGTTIEANDEYFLWALRMVEMGQKSIYEFHDRRVNSILRRRLGIPTSIVEFKRGLALKDPFVTYAWKDRLNSCEKIYTVKFYRLDKKPAEGIPMEEYEYMDDKKAAEEHFERFQNDRSLLYARIELTEVSAKTVEKVLQTIVF